MDLWNRLSEHMKKFKEWWKSRSTAQKYLIGGSVVAILIAVIIGVYVATHPPYTLLIGGLSEEEAGAVTSKLEELGIPYKVGAGNRIYIPVKYNVYEVRMKLASAGVLRGDKGYELIEQGGLGATSFDKQVRYQIALQGELERSIKTIRGIRAARVHLVLPKYTYYVRGNMTEPRAAVLVVLDPGVELTREQIKGIMELVAGAVEGLKLENVKVIDQYSRVLSDRVLADMNTMMATSKLELKMELEKYYREKIKSTLEKVFGLGRVEVIPDIKLNWTKIEKEIKRYEKPDRKGGLIRSQQTESEKAVNMPPSGGAVGSESNIPPGYQYITGEGSGSYERNSQVVNYELNETYEKIIQNEEGEIKEMSISVVVDASSSVIKGQATKWASEVKDLVEKGIAASASVTDLKVAVAFLPFDRSLEKELYSAKLEEEKRTKFRLFATGILLLTVIMFMLVYLLMLQIKKKKAKKIIEERKSILEEELRKALMEEEVEEEILTEESKEMKELTDRLERAFGKDPADIAYVIKLWIGSSS